MPCPIPRYSHLKRGTKVPGKVWDCHHKWVVFDGTIPHMTMPFVGKRYTIVYFTGKIWLSTKPHNVGFMQS